MKHEFFIVATSAAFSLVHSIFWYITSHTIFLSPSGRPHGFLCNVLLSPFQHIALVKRDICHGGYLEIERGLYLWGCTLTTRTENKLGRFCLAVQQIRRFLSSKPEHSVVRAIWQNMQHTDAVMALPSVPGVMLTQFRGTPCRKAILLRN
jgi:hypothetical protein